MIPATLAFDPAADTLIVRVPAAEGDGDVTLLTFDLKTLTADDKRRLRHIRDEAQAQRPAGDKAVTRGGA